MIGMENKKLVSLKSLLLRSWRERWPDTYWSIQVKQILKFDAESDQCLLADLLLQQGLAGSTPNLLVISYFKHAVNARMMSWHIGLESILKFEDSTKVYCLKALVEIVESLMPRICVNGNQEDSWALSTTSLKLVNWLLSLTSGCLEKVIEDCQPAEYATVATKICVVLEAMIGQETLIALLRTVHMELPELYQRMREYEGKSKSFLKSLDSPHLNLETKSMMERGLSITSKIAAQPKSGSVLLNPSYQPINASINVLLHIDAVLNPTGDIHSFKHQLYVLKTTQGISYPSLIGDMLRTCFAELIESAGGSDELKWSAFTFLKMPQIFLQLCKMPGAEAGHVMQGLEKVLSYQPLLDLADSKCNAECMELLCTELCSSSISLLNQSQMQVLLERRTKESKNLAKVDQSNSQQSGLPTPSLILRAAPTMHSMLTTLEADYTKNFEGLIGVMGKMMGKNFDLLLTVAAAVSGKVQAFATELIKFSEMTKLTSGEGGKGAQARSHLFDINFLMLCHIAQTYGIESCHGNKPGLEKSFFIKWAQMWLPEDGQYKPLDGPLVQDDPRIDSLLAQMQPTAELKTSLTRWNEVLYSVRYATQEILNAWEYEALSQDQVKNILSSLKTKMSCLCVGVATFLCSYISQVEHQRQQKPLQMIEMLLQGQPQFDPNNTNFYMAERSQMLHMILSKLVQNVLPPSSSHYTPLPYSLPIKEPLQNVLEESWSAIFKSGTITTLQLQRMENILSVGGCQWFSSVLIKKLLLEERVEDLHKGACLLFSLFSLAMHNLTICLLHHTLPMLFQSCRNQLLTGPRGSVLAKLCVSCLLMLQPLTPSGTDEEVVMRKSRKRNRSETDLEDSYLDLNVIRGPGRSKFMNYPRPSKIRKSESSGALPTAHLDDQDAVIIEPDNILNSHTMEQSMEPLDIATAGLMRTFDGVIKGHHISEKTQFIYAFLLEVVRAGDQLSHYVVQFMPPNMILQLLKLMPSQFDLDVLLAICDLSSTPGRKLASKVICQYEQLQRRSGTVIASKG